MAEAQQLRIRLAEVEEENTKLRQVEQQFWLLLAERDSDRRGPDPAPVTKAGTSEPQASRADHERLVAALHECMELLIVKDRGEDVGLQRGPVAAFLSWCEIEHSRKECGIEQGQTPDSQQPRNVASANTVMSLDERAFLVGRVRQLENENRQLQDELDRADISRLQALEDADRLHRHVASLSEKVLVLRDAANSERHKADTFASSQALALSLKAQLAEKDVELAHLAAELAHLKRTEPVGGAELAADAARIREELYRRTLKAA